MTFEEAVELQKELTPEQRKQGRAAVDMGTRFGHAILAFAQGAGMQPPYVSQALEIVVAVVAEVVAKKGCLDAYLVELTDHVKLQIVSFERGREADAMGEAQGNA